MDVANDAFNMVHLVRSVDLFTLKLFLRVVEEEQVARAAVRENIAASAVTKRIQDLESVVGATLFERTARGVLTTMAGKVLARHVAKVFAAMEDARHDFGEFSQGVRGKVRICAAGGLISLYVADEIAEFTRGFPAIDIELKDVVNCGVAREVALGGVDVGIFALIHDNSDVEGVDAIPYRTDRLVAVVAQGHPLAARASVRAIELLDHDYIGVDLSSRVMTNVRQSAAIAGVEFRPRYNVSSVYAAAGLVRGRQGVTIMPENMLTTADLEWASPLTLDETWATRHIVVASQKGRSLSAAARNFVAQLTLRARVPAGA